MKSKAPDSDLAQGLWRGHSVAKVYTHQDGTVALVGRSARDNDLLSLKLGRPYDFWFHVAAGSGSHVVVLNPQKLRSLPREVRRWAGALAAKHSKMKKGGRVAVHLCFCSDVSKPRGYAPGKVRLKRYESLDVNLNRDLVEA